MAKVDENAVQKEQGSFRITRADHCIWLDDLRPTEPDAENASGIHMTPGQAEAVGLRLIGLAHGAELVPSTNEETYVG